MPRLSGRRFRYQLLASFLIVTVAAAATAFYLYSRPAPQAQAAPAASSTAKPRPAPAPSPTPSAGAPGPRHVHAWGAALVNASTDTGIWSKSLNVERPMGSITKVMTALLVIQAGDLNRKIRVTRAAIQYVRRDDASSAWLKRGDVLTARQLLEAMLIPSGCDAAYLLATAYGPGRPAFIQRMNAMAQTLGMTSTRFTTFDGMPFPTEHSTYSTPADLIRLGEQAMQYPLFRQIVAQRSYRLSRTGLHHRYVWLNTNQMLLSYRGLIGIKTGDTAAAGNCLLFAASRAGHTLIGVVLHADPSDTFTAAFTDAARMLNWGFRQLGG